MDAVLSRIFEMMEGIEEDPRRETKSWILGQIAGNISKGDSVWTIQGYADGSGEILEEILEELQVTYTELTCNDSIFTIKIG